jgi:hypothetical protein
MSTNSDRQQDLFIILAEGRAIHETLKLCGNTSTDISLSRELNASRRKLTPFHSKTFFLHTNISYEYQELF